MALPNGNGKTPDPPASDVPLTLVLARLGDHEVMHSRRGGAYYAGRCPSCRGEGKLSVHEQDSGRVVLICDDGCSKLSILPALSLTAEQLLPRSERAREPGEEEQRLPSIWRLSELLENEELMRPPPAVVPRLAWAGRSTLLAAREKRGGKSTLVGYVAARVTRGEAFLGEPCPLGTALIIGLEEFLGDLARRLRHFGADPDRTFVTDRVDGPPELRTRRVRELVADLRPSLMVIDSLFAFGIGVVQDHTRAQAGEIVQELTDIAHQTGVALILVHHATKGGGYRDSTAIAGAVDVLIEMAHPEEEEKKQDEDPNLRRLRARGRTQVPPITDIRFEQDSYRLVNGSESALSLEERIIAFVRDHPSCSQNAVEGGVSGGKGKEKRDEIRRLLDAGRLVNLGTGGALRLAVPEDAPAQPELSACSH